MRKRPRDCQLNAIEAIREAFAAGKRGVCIEAFTGFGKAFVIAAISEMSRKKGGRVLCLVNRDNLCEQLFRSLQEQGLFPQMERGQDKASNLAEMVVGSIQTMQGDRLKRWNPDHFRLVISDEVQFGASRTFKSTLDHFRSAHHVGVTATIERHDKAPIWNGYEDVVFRMPLTEGISEGWLVPLVFKELPVPITLSDSENAKKIFGEADELGVFSRDSYLPRLFEASGAECVGRKAIMFWPGVDASKAASEAFATSGLESRHIDSYMSQRQIDETLEWFKPPGPKVIHNADLLSYGYDNPSVDLVGIMRLSRSLPMLKQRIGRGTRTFDANVDDYEEAEQRRFAISISPKPSCLILDLMLQLGAAQSSFAHVGQLITDDKEEADYLRVKRNAGGVQIDLDGLKDLLKVRQVDESKSLNRLAEDAANAAMKKSTGKEPFYGHILKKCATGKPASDPAINYLQRLGYTGPRSITAQACYRITELYKKNKQGLKLV